MVENNLKFAGRYRGKVLATDAEEEQKLGRIKAEIYPMLIGIETAKTLTNVEGIETENLPWAVPAMPIFEGAGEGFGCLCVPKVESFVWVFFEEGDIYQPVYFAEAQTAEMGLPTERLTNYPHTKVWKTTKGIVITINDREGSEEIKVLHPTGAYVQIDNNGNINISGTTVNINP